MKRLLTLTRQPRFRIASVLVFAMLAQCCGGDTFLQASARLASVTKSIRVILENAYDDKLLSRELVLDIARPMQRLQKGQSQVFNVYEKYHDPSTGNLTITPEVAAELAGIVLALKTDFATLKQKSNSQGVASPTTAILQPALASLEAAFNAFIARTESIKGVRPDASLMSKIFRVQIEQHAADLRAAVRLSEDQIAIWVR